MSWFDVVKKLKGNQKNLDADKDGDIDGDDFKTLREMKKENKKPMDRVSTTASKLPQDEEAAKRTEENESELLAQMRARNKETRETLRGGKNE